MSFAELKAPEPVDVVWTSENYHDFKNMGMFNTDTNAMNRAVFAALKPGGRYIVTDYVAVAGSGARDTQMLHRIDPALIRSEVTAAGFTMRVPEQRARPCRRSTHGAFGPVVGSGLFRLPQTGLIRLVRLREP